MPGNNLPTKSSKLNFKRAKELYNKELQLVDGQNIYEPYSRMNYNELYKIMGYDDYNQNPIDQLNETNARFCMIDGAQTMQEFIKQDNGTTLKFNNTCDNNKNEFKTINVLSKDDNFLEHKHGQFMPGMIDFKSKFYQADAHKLATLIQKNWRGFLSRKYKYD